ncbi:unnamed protein product [Urochloa humidicola]
MSGGVGSTAGGGMTLASMGTPPPPLHPTPTSPTARPHHHNYHFSTRHFIALGAAAVLAFSTTVSLSDIAFAVLLLPYLLFLARFAFPQHKGKANPAAPLFSDPADRLRVVVHMAVPVGLLVGTALPALYILDGLRAGDTAGVAAAAPHAFLLSAQVLFEGIAAAWPGTFSLPVAAAVPVMFNARRMFTASEWLREELQERGPPVAAWRVVAGRAVAASNLAFWGFNLFAFLLPFYLPKVLRRYYLGTDREEDGEDESRAKEGEGKKDS